MFPIHETRRRMLCRAIFLLLVPAPTLAVGAWCGARYLPSYTAAYEDRLSATLGVRVRIDAVTHPRPGKTVLHGVELFDPEQGATIASCDELTMTHAKGTLLISAEQATVERGQIGRGWESLHARLRRPDTLPTKTKLLVRSLRVGTRPGFETLQRVDLTIESGRDGVKSSLAFGLFGSASDEPVRVGIVRKRETAPPATTVTLITGPTALPCSLLSLSDEGLSALGPQSQFSGVLIMRQTPDGWKCEITGHCTKIDLDGLVKQHLSRHKLSGSVNLWIESADKDLPGAELINGRLVRAEGIIYVEQGRVGGSLIGALEQHLNIPPVYPKKFPDQEFRWLRAKFQLDASGLSIRGPTDGPGAVMVDRDLRPLLGQTPSPQPLGGLVNSLLRQDEPSARAYLEAILPRPALLR